MAAEVLEAAGRPATDATRDRIANTLRAAAATAEGREVLKAGRLTEELEQPGFEAFADLATVRKKTRQDGGRATQEDVREQRRAIQQQVKEAQEEARQHEKEADELMRQVREAERALDKMRAQAAKARERADESGERVRELKDALAQLETR